MAVRHEAARQPISFFIGVAGGIGLLYTAFTSLAAFFSPISIPTPQLGIVGKACGFFVLQCTLSAIYARAVVFADKLGTGLPVILTLVATVVCAWLSSFISFWLTVPGMGGNAAPTFLAAGFVAWLIVMYFCGTYFDDAKVGVGSQFGYWFLITFGLVSFGFYFGLQIPAAQ